MARPTLESVKIGYTTRQASKYLNISRAQLLRRIDRGVLPEPSVVDEHGTRFFNQVWLDDAKAKMRRARM